jgi:putative sterol carrier protein
MPDEVNDVELDVTLHGLGHIVSLTSVKTAGLVARQRIHPTPIDAERIALFALASVQEMPDPAYTREMDEIFWDAFVADFPRDFPIWENKAYLDKPLLAGGDGPIGRYRRWARQFYDAGEPTAAAATAAEPKTVVERLTRWLRDLSQRPGQQEEEIDTHGPGKRREVRAEAPVARFPSVDAYFDTLAARFDRDAAGDLEAVFQWVLTGEAGRAHFVEIRGGRAQVADGVHPAPTLTIEMTSADYLAMINGELNGARAFATGRGKLRGPVRLAMRMQRLFPLERTV